MVRILEKPAALSFSGNLTKFLVESDQPFAFSLKKKSAASSIFEHTYYPGTDKRSRIDVSNIIEDYLYFTLQANTNVHLQPNIKGVFVATIDTQTVEFEVIRGGISNLADTTVNWLKYNFLTWQPIEKNVTYHSPEWISWYAVSTCALMLDATFEDQSRKSIKITDCQPGNVYTANLQYGYIAGLLGKLPSYYDVYLLYTDSQKSQVQRYLASDPKNEDEIYVGWENSLGGYDVARMSGYSTFENEGKHEVGSNGDSLEEYNTELSKKHVCNTGLMTLNERFWFVDFFISKRRHVYIDNAMREIVLSEDKGSIDTAETIDGLSFTFREKEDSKYLNIPRLRELPSDITIPVPALPDFNLPPRLVEYARITLDEGVLFPAQHPSSQTCGVTTWGAMSTIINKWITDAIAGIKFPDIPDIPETLPPGPHTHPIEDVVQLKTELERRLLKETFDALFRYDATLDCLFVSKPIAVQGSVTMYSNAGTLDLPSIYDGIPLGDGLVWKDGKIVVTVGGGLDEAALGNYLTTHKYATQTWVTSQLSSLHTHSNKSVLDAITSGKVTAWDSKESALGNPTTSGYLLSSTTAGVRSWVKPYELTKDDVVRVLKDADGCIRLDASMLLSGGMTMLSDLGFDVPSIFDNAPIATPTSKGMLDTSILGTGLSWSSGKLTATATAGTFDHTALSNRNTADQHSIAAITGLQAALDGKSPIHSHPYRPDTWMPTAAQVGALAVNGKAADSDKLDGIDSDGFARRIYYGATNLNNMWGTPDGFYTLDGALENTPIGTANMRVLCIGGVHRGTQMAFDWISNRAFFRRKQDTMIGDWCEFYHTANLTSPFAYKGWIAPADLDKTIDKGNGDYVIAYDGATQRLITFGSGGGSCSSMEMIIDYHGNMKTRTSIDANRFSEWYGIYTGRNANLSTVDWAANVGRFYSGVQTFGNESYINLGVDKDGGAIIKYSSDGHLKFIPRYGFDNVFERGAVGIRCIPAVTLAIGDSDTGFNWVGDGHLKGVANGVDVFGWYNNTFYSHGKIVVGSGGDQELVTRHISGKHYQNDSDSDLYLNWRSGLPTHTGGNLSIGGQNATCNATLHVHGNILADGGITMLSDMRLKNRISNVKSVLPSISGIDVFRYTLKADVTKRTYIGVSAQQIQGIWSEFVHGVETLSLDYAQMAAYVAIKGLQETKLWMNSKDKKIVELEKRIVELENNVA